MALRDTELPGAPSSGSDALVRCEALTISYRNAGLPPATAVDRASFTIAPGQAIGIVGESGSGKSTLARALLGYRRAGAVFESGSLHFLGKDLARADDRALRTLRGISVAMVPQNPLASLTYHLRVGEQIVEVLLTRAGLGRAAAQTKMLDLLERTGLHDPRAISRRYPHQLSGGQRQRVVIAAALACQPALLVLDEPTTALDKTTEAQVLDLVAGLRRDSGAALVLVTHDLNVVARVCDRVLVMSHGKIVESGPVDQVFSRPQEPYTRTLLAASLRIDAADAPQVVVGAAPLLQVENLRFDYSRPSWFGRSVGVAPALQSVSLAVGKGEVLGVIGESGSGKTTLGLIIAGLLDPGSGAVLFDGLGLRMRPGARSRDLRRRIQMIFQDPLSSLNPRRTVGASITRPMRLFFGIGAAAARDRATGLLESLGMDASYLERYPRHLSGGQQQRVAIARAFAAEPDLLVADEITSALDASVQAQVLEELQRMQRARAAAMLLITHDLSVVWKMAPRVVVLQGGRIVEEGETARVFARPSSAYTAGLLEAATLAGRMRAA